MITFPNTIRTLNEYGRRIADLYRNKNLQAGYDPAAELQNITFRVESNAGVFSIDFNMPDYWRYAENGRGPGRMPPEGSLLKWMEFKQILPAPMTLANGRTVIPSMKSLEYLIRRKIGRDGTEGQHTWEQTENDIKSDLIRAVTESLKKDCIAYLESLRKAS